MGLTTEFPTYAVLESDIETECSIDVSNENEFVTQAQLIHFANKGIDRAEKLINTIYEDYFLCRDTVNLVADTEEYAPPTDLWAMKIRSLIYYDTSRVYEVLKFRNWKKFIEYRMERTFDTSTSGNNYRYFILNETAGAWKLLVTPMPKAAGTIEIWYWRQANRIVLTTDVMDVPEAKDLILAYMRYRVVALEFKGNLEATDVAAAKADLMDEEERLRQSLALMVVDAATEIEQDNSHYEDHE